MAATLLPSLGSPANQRQPPLPTVTVHWLQDEHAMKEEGRMSNPIFSSVYYVTGSSEEGTLRQARTGQLWQPF